MTSWGYSIKAKPRLLIDAGFPGTMVKLVVVEGQAAALAGMRAYMKPEQPYRAPDLDAAVRISFAESRGWLANLGVAGEIVPTPGHSDDSVSVVLAAGARRDERVSGAWTRAQALRLRAWAR